MASVKVDQDNFQKEVLDYQGVVLVDFWAPWCGPCQLMGPILEELATANQGKAKIAKVNIDENQSLALRYQIRSIPTLMIFKNGQVVEQIIGVRAKETLQEKIDAVLSQKTDGERK